MLRHTVPWASPFQAGQVPGAPSAPECQARGPGYRKDGFWSLSCTHPPSPALAAHPAQSQASEAPWPSCAALQAWRAGFLVRRYRKDRGRGAAYQEPDPSRLQPRPHREWPCRGWPALRLRTQPSECQPPGCASHVGRERTCSSWLSWLPLCFQAEMGGCCPGNQPSPNTPNSLLR